MVDNFDFSVKRGSVMIDRENLYLTACAFGLGLSGALEVANLSTILQLSGIKAHLISYLWLIAASIGFFTQLTVGILSDNLYTRFGQKRPLFVFCTLACFIGILGLPFARTTFYLIVFILLLNLGLNGNLQLLHLLILDLKEAKAKTKAFIWLGGLSGLGAMTGGLLPWLFVNVFHFPRKITQHILPDYLYLTFVIGAILFFLSSLITFLTIKESIGQQVVLKKIKVKEIILLGKTLCYSLWNFPKFLGISYSLLFAWGAVFSFCTYLSIFIAQLIYHMPSTLVDDYQAIQVYLTKANVLASNYVSLFQTSSLCFSFLILYLNKHYTIQQIFTVSLLAGGLSFILMTLFANPYIMSIFIIIYGATWASLAICPFAIFAQVVPKENKGFHFGLLNTMTVIPQVIMGLCVGKIYKYVFLNHASYIMIMAGFGFLASAYFSFREQTDSYTNVNSKKQKPQEQITPI